VSERIVKQSELSATAAVVTMMNGSEIRCPKECILKLCIEGKELTTRCLVASILSGVDLLLGIDVVRCMGGVW
jgi:hypothetical protein